MWKREQFANKGRDGALEVAIVRKESRMRISLDSYVVIGVISVIIRIVKAGRMSELLTALGALRNQQGSGMQGIAM